MRTYGTKTYEEIEDIAISIFDPERLVPNIYGDVLLCAKGSDIALKVDCWDPDTDSWLCLDIDKGPVSMPSAQAYDPRDAEKLCYVLAASRLPIMPHENAAHEEKRIRDALGMDL